MGCFSSKEKEDKVNEIYDTINVMSVEIRRLQSRTERLIYENALIKEKKQLLELRLNRLSL